MVLSLIITPTVYFRLQGDRAGSLPQPRLEQLVDTNDAKTGAA